MAKRALVSVHNKEGLVEFCQGLAGLGFEIVSTGGTHATLEKAGVPVVQVAQLTSFPEILGGRVKTLHPAIHGGILAKRTPEHLEELKKHNLSTIDIVVCNLYPFQETVRKEGVTEGEIVEQIDIGGVTLLRAAAKNFESVLVVCDPADYAGVLAKLQAGGGADAGAVPMADRKRFALKAFRHTATYDSAISQWLSGSLEEGKSDSLPGQIALTAEKVETLRYGENPHQQGALYRWSGADAPFEQVSGKELSYNNILDLDVAYAIVQEYSDPCVVVIKHNTPCGIATDPNIITAYQKAFESDPVSAFGSIIAINREITVELCEAIGKLFLEVLVSHAYTPEALEWLANKKKNCRVLIAKNDVIRRQRATQEGSLVVRSVFGGLLVQTPDDKGTEVKSQWKVVSKKQPTPEIEAGLAFAWLASKHVKSNAIVLVQGTSTVGIGTGQPNRVDSVVQAAKRAGDKAQGSMLASDAFFPFADGIEEAAKAGVIAVIQPGGSIRDEDVIAKVDELGLVMVFTGERHFKH
jgi:phosphoribosylaminoimidazolecarboxamide formyltransferase/IMP cyclohydrolase